MNQRVVKALSLLSGGLDSMLAARLLMEQNIAVTALVFKSCFFSEEAAQKSAKQLNVPLKVVDFSEEHLEIVIRPKHGYGAGANPCIDCHALMLRIAKKIMEEEGYDFVATGEVLGQRPMSQTAKNLKIIQEESGLDGYLIRPLTAKNLDLTIPEKNGLLDRNKLLDISGRSRKIQRQLAEKWQLKEYPNPAGGCILTEKDFGNRFKDLKQREKNLKADDILLLRAGKNFWIDDVLAIFARDQKEGEALPKLASKGNLILECQNYPGPVVLLRAYGKGIINDQVILRAQQEMQARSAKGRGKNDFSIIKKTAP